MINKNWMEPAIEELAVQDTQWKTNEGLIEDEYFLECKKLYES